MSRLDDALELLTAGGLVTGNMRLSAQNALAAVADEDQIVAAYRCGIVAGATRGEGVAVFTPTRLSVFDCRGFRSLDQDFRLSLTEPFTVDTGSSPTQVQILVPRRRPVTLELLEPEAVEAFRKHLGADGAAQAWGWWSSGWVRWPGWLDARASCHGPTSAVIPASVSRSEKCGSMSAPRGWR